MIETLRFVLCALLLGLGLIFEICAVIGVFRFHYVLNRMHAAALGDTMVFTDLLKEAGLGNPFDGETLRKVCEAADKYLEDYDLSGIE